ncbi:MAG: hypothetical protein DSY42_02020, partial [Aquifex sp.]
MGIEKLQNIQTFNSSSLKAFSSNLKFNQGDFLEIFLKLLGESSETSNDVKTAEKLDGNLLFSKQAILPINLLFPNTQVEYDGENISEKTLSNFPNEIPKAINKNLHFLTKNLVQISAENLEFVFIHKSLEKEHKPTQIDNYILNRQGDIKTSKSKDLQPQNFRFLDFYLDLKDSNIKQYKNYSRAVSNKSLNLFDEINFENLKDYGINIKLHNKVDKGVLYSQNFQTEALTSKGKFERKESKSGEINHAVQVEIKELPQERIKVQESEKSLMLKDFRIFEKDGEKRITVKFNELGFEIRFLQDTAKLRFTLNQQLANFITSYDAVRISQIFQSLGVKLESVNINGQEIYGRNKSKDRGNIRVD